VLVSSNKLGKNLTI